VIRASQECKSSALSNNVVRNFSYLTLVIPAALNSRMAGQAGTQRGWHPENVQATGLTGFAVVKRFSLTSLRLLRAAGMTEGGDFRLRKRYPNLTRFAVVDRPLKKLPKSR